MSVAEITRTSSLHRLVAATLGEQAAADAFAVLKIAPELQGDGKTVSRAELAMALAAVLFQRLLERVPTAAAYVADVRRVGGTVDFDHGALRTIDGETGKLPRGEAAFTRVLEPLGYQLAGTYPLDRLKMTGRSYAHADLPEAIPQYFVSELHVDRFSPAFQAAAAHVFGASRDPLDAAAKARLATLVRERALPYADAEALLPVLAGAFERQHPEPMIADYETLLAESAEAAWIATEGNAFNHATDRVPDLDALVASQREKRRPMKEAIEVSRNGRVRQTAFKADPVERGFVDADDRIVRRTVPGSFYEFIERAPKPEGGLDLSFDSGNAQGIFKMTEAQPG